MNEWIVCLSLSVFLLYIIMMGYSVLSYFRMRERPLAMACYIAGHVGRNTEV